MLTLRGVRRERTALRLTKHRIRFGEYDQTLYGVLAAPEANCACIMRTRERPILVETYKGRFPTGLSASDRAQRYEVALALREGGWAPYRIRFDAEEAVWVANVIDWGLAA